MSKQLNRIQNWTEMARQVNWSPKGLAALCRVTVRTLELYFNEEMGECPHTWLFEQRMQQASDLLRNGRSVTEVAIMLGYKYENRSHFSRDYKKRWGYSPSVQQKIFLGKRCRIFCSPEQPSVS
jgi:transcriptional regulator GlxA family with amidase domain